MIETACDGEQRVVLFATAPLSAVDGPGSRVVVYFQGCDTACAWCHSPHSRLKTSPLLFRADACALCGRCLEACPNGAHTLTDGIHRVDRSSCQSCGSCVEACPHSSASKDSGVLFLPTREVAVSALLNQLLPALSIADGITLSGGEALLQTEAAVTLLRLCRERGIHTAVETSGLLESKRYAAAAPYTDVWLFGLRVCVSPDGEYRTGTVLASLNRLQGFPNTVIIPRIPAVPGVMDKPETLRELLRVLERINTKELWINPWNRFYTHYYTLSGIKAAFPLPSEGAARRCESKMQTFFTRKGYRVNMTSLWHTESEAYECIIPKK